MKKNIYILAVFTIILSLGVVSLAHAQNDTSFNVSLGYLSTERVEIMKLQNFLFSQGYLKIAPTGRYLSLTRKAVMDLQKALGISPATGYFGPLTRSLVNQRLLSTNTVNQTANQAVATISIRSVINATIGSAATILSGAKTINWQTTNYPEGAGVNINLIRKTSDSPKTFVVIRTIGVDIVNDGEETWIPQDSEKSNDVYIEMTCSNSYQFQYGCKFLGEPIKVN